MKDLNRKIALFISSGTEGKDADEIIAEARPLEAWADGVSQYTRVTNWAEFEFDLRPAQEYVPEQIEALREKKEELTREFQKNLAKIDELIGTLAAIEYKPENV